MINLHERREQKDYHAEILTHELDQVDLTTIQIGDWIEGIGTVDTYTMVGFLHHLGRHGFKIVKVAECLK